MTPMYISTVGYAKLEAELKHLLEVERPGVVANVSAAAEEGDRSENAEYIYGKKRMRQIDKRIEFLSKRLDKLVPIKEAATDARVVFLSYVRVETPKGDEKVYRLVGADETDGEAGYISSRSPVGQALVGSLLDDEVSVETPGGIVSYVVLEISITPLT